MKYVVKSKVMCITVTGFFIIFSISAYNYNISLLEKLLNLGKNDDVPRGEKLLLFNHLDTLMTPRRTQKGQKKQNILLTENSTNFTDHIHWENIQKMNKLRIQNGCKKWQNGTIKSFSMDELLSSQRFRLQNFLVDDHHKAIYCYIPKVACTQWKRILMVLTGQYHTDNPEAINNIIAHYRSGLMTLASAQYKEEDITDRLQRYKKFIIVRHPLERLLSAFTDKFQGKDIDAKAFQKFYAPSMMKFSRNLSSVGGTDGSGMKFQEFLYFLAHNDAVNYQEHWRPFFYLCHPCVINFDFIGKFENLEVDSNNILRNLEGSPNISFPTMKHSNTKNILKQIIKDIPLPLLQKIKEVYNLDFRLFGYS